jgi:peptidoglycan/xylan/chitin deacetylase (PgdA/CDA1 family)
VTSRKPDIQGVVPVLMYHRIGNKEAYMVRSRANFRYDLERLRRLGFRPVTLAEYARNEMKLAPGASPVVFTFDDSHPDQASFDAKGRFKPDTYVGIWQSFALEHPDFPVKATFFVNDNGPFGSRKNGPIIIKKLLEMGCEIGGHTVSHGDLRKASSARAAREIGRQILQLRKMGVEPKSFAPPYGSYPRSIRTISSFRYEGRQMGYGISVLAGDRPAPSPESERFNPLRIPRIIASPVQGGIETWLVRMKAGRPAPYVQP